MNTNIAIIIPFFNRKEFLLKTLRSLIGLFSEEKAHECIKIYLMDDGSDLEIFSDSDIPKELKAVSTIVRLKHVGNPAHAKNEGARLAENADYLFFLDSDDVIEPTALFSVFNAANSKAQADVFPMNSFYIDEKDQRFMPYGKEKKYSFLDPRPIVWNVLGHKSAMLKANHIGNFPLIRKKAFDKIGGFREDVVVEDYEIWLRAQYMGLKFHFLKDAAYGVRVHSQGRSFNKKKEIQDVLDFLEDERLRRLMGKDAEVMKKIWLRKMEQT